MTSQSRLRFWVTWPFGLAYVFIVGLWYLLRGEGDRL